MTNILLYFLQVSVVFSVCYLLYIAVFRRLTFHSANRVVLLLLVPISLLIPLSVSWFPSLSASIIEIPLLNEIAIDAIVHSQLQVEEMSYDKNTYIPLLFSIYMLVVLIHLARIIMTVKNLFVLWKQAIIEQKDGYQLVLSNVPNIFSYFYWIFIPEEQFDQYDKPEILAHEVAHIRLKHSWDVILSEIYIAFFWFNPLLYSYRKSLKSIHEFQADRSVIEKEMTSTNYLRLLLTTLDLKKTNNLYNYFNHPILKKRIDMITKTTSNKFAKFTYILLLPLCLFLISAFTKPTIQEFPFSANANFFATISLPPSLFPVQNGNIKNITAHFGDKGKHPRVNKGVVHTGIDIRAAKGTPVLATADGIVVKAAKKGNWGNLIVITHSDGYETWYAHLQGFNIKEKQEVKTGDIIGYVGNTGRSTGPHLHYEIKQFGKYVNPLDYLK